MRVTNHGSRKWQIERGVYVLPGQSAEVSVDSWRLALDLNPAMPYAVGTELVIEEETQPAQLPPVLADEVVFIEDEPEPEPVEIEATPEPMPEPEQRQGKRKKGRR